MRAFSGAIRQIAFSSAVAFTLTSSSVFGSAISWSVLHDYSGTSTPTSQQRSLRGLALSDDDSKVFVGFIQGSTSSALNKVDTTTGNVDQTLTIANSRQPKAMATDDRGNVYTGSNTTSDGQFRIYDSSLNLINTVTPSGSAGIGGLSVQKVGGTYYLYVARQSTTSATVERYIVTNTGVVNLDTTFGAAGSFNVRSFVSTATSLTGLEVDSDGTIYLTDRDDTATNGSVYKIAADLSSVQTTAVPRAMDLALYGGFLYVTEYNANTSAIGVLDQATMTLVDTWQTGFTHDNVTDTGYAGIDVTADGRLFVADEIYKNTPSSVFQDRILVSSPVPEPTSAALLATGALFGMRRRARREI